MNPFCLHLTGAGITAVCGAKLFKNCVCWGQVQILMLKWQAFYQLKQSTDYDTVLDLL